MRNWLHWRSTLRRLNWRATRWHALGRLLLILKLRLALELLGLRTLVLRRLLALEDLRRLKPGSWARLLRLLRLLRSLQYLHRPLSLLLSLLWRLSWRRRAHA